MSAEAIAFLSRAIVLVFYLVATGAALYTALTMVWVGRRVVSTLMALIGASWVTFYVAVLLGLDLDFGFLSRLFHVPTACMIIATTVIMKRTEDEIGVS